MTADPRDQDPSREASVRPHETNQFRNAVEYTVQVTFVVAGGARWRTAYGRARRVAERLANTAARTSHVLEVTAVAGPSRDGQLASSQPIFFAAANAGHATSADPTTRSRYLDPGYQRALASLAAANAGEQARQQAVLARRCAVGCANPSQTSWHSPPPCGCVYCRSRAHLEQRDHAAGHRQAPPRCWCGRPVAADGRGCPAHHGHQLVVLDGDPDELRQLADLTRPCHLDGRDRPDRPPDLEPPPPGR